MKCIANMEKLMFYLFFMLLHTGTAYVIQNAKMNETDHIFETISWSNEEIIADQDLINNEENVQTDFSVFTTNEAPFLNISTEENLIISMLGYTYIPKIIFANKYLQIACHFCENEILNEMTEAEYLTLLYLYSFIDKDFVLNNLLLEISAKLNNFSTNNFEHILINKCEFSKIEIYEAFKNFIVNKNKILLQIPDYINEKLFTIQKMYDTLFISIIKNDEEMINFLINSGHDVNGLPQEGEFTPIQLAWKLNSDKIVKMLLNYGALMNNTKKNMDIIMEENDDDETLLTYLIKNGFNDKIKVFCQNITDNLDYNSSIIYKSLKFGQINTTELLIECSGVSKEIIFKTYLIYAIKNNDLSTVNSILNLTGTINVTDVEENMPIHAAALFDRVTVIPKLIERGLDVNAKSRQGNTPLHLAAQHNQIQSIKILIKEGAIVDITNDRGLTPLYYAANFNHIDAAELLIQNHADINFKIKHSEYIDEVEGNTLLHMAVENNNFISIRNFIKLGADISEKNSRGQTPGHLALRNKKFTAASILYKYGAYTFKDNDQVVLEAIRSGLSTSLDTYLKISGDPNLVDQNGNSLLHTAVKYNKVDIVKLLLQDSRINVNAKSNLGQTPLHVVKSVEITELLIKHGALINEKDYHDYTPLFRAVLNSEIDICEILINNKADLTTRDQNGMTPLLWAVSNDKKYDLIKLLAKHSSTSYKLNGLAPLHIAVLKGNFNTVLGLLEGGADANIKTDHKARTPLQMAAKTGLLDICKILLQWGAYIDEVNSDSWSALHEAAYYDHYFVVRLLVVRGANYKLRNNWFFKPSGLAWWAGNMSIYRFLTSL